MKRLVLLGLLIVAALHATVGSVLGPTARVKDSAVGHGHEADAADRGDSDWCAFWSSRITRRCVNHCGRG
jgi:hypothetical protein